MQIYEKIFCYFRKNTTFAPTKFDDIHNKDYSESVNIQSGTLPCRSFIFAK